MPATVFYFTVYDQLKYGMGYREGDPSTRYIPVIAGSAARSKYTSPQCKWGKWQETNSLSRKTQRIWTFCQNTEKTQGIVCVQVMNPPILNNRGILIFTTNFSKFSLKINVLAKSVLHMKQWQITEIGTLRYAVGEGKYRKFVHRILGGDK